MPLPEAVTVCECEPEGVREPLGETEREREVDAEKDSLGDSEMEKLGEPVRRPLDPVSVTDSV